MEDHENSELSTFHANGSLLRNLSSEEVEFYVIGGLATHFYGCRRDIPVDDLDILVISDCENIKKLERAARRSGINLSSPTKIDQKIQISLKSYYYIDIVIDIDIETEINRASCPPAKINNIACSILDLGSLIRMKEAAASAAPKHQSDLICLKMRLEDLTSRRRPSR